MKPWKQGSTFPALSDVFRGHEVLHYDEYLLNIDLFRKVSKISFSDICSFLFSNQKKSDMLQEIFPGVAEVQLKKYLLRGKGDLETAIKLILENRKEKEVQY